MTGCSCLSRYRSESSIELDNILLVVAQTGVYLYASFNIIASHFSNDLTSLATSVMAITQVTGSMALCLDTELKPPLCDGKRI